MSNEYPLALPEGTILNGKYIIKRVLGQGGFGITYEASVHKSNEIVAIKEYLPDTMASRSTNTTVSAFSGERGANFEYGKQCFLEEAKTLANFIGNPGIVEVKKYFEENGTAYFVMEFVKGKSYKDYLEDKGGKIPIDEALKILTPVMDALSAVHSRGIIHRDVTPDNICITDDGKVKLLDFGAARYSLGDKSRSLDVVLKHGYAPKEQYTRHGRQGPYTDVYAFAVTIYRSITGRLIQDSIDRLEEDSLILPSALGVKISERQENALLKALAVDSRDRYQSMAEFKAALLGEENAAAAPVVGGSNEIVFTAPKNDHTELQQQTAVSSQASINSSQKTGTDILKPTVQDNKTVNDPQDANVQGQTNSTATKKNKLPLVAAAVVGALVIIGGIVALIPKGNSNVQGEIVEEAKVDSTEASEQGAKEENSVKEGELKAEGSDDANSDIKTFDSQGSMDGRIQADVGSKDNTYKLENMGISFNCSTKLETTDIKPGASGGMATYTNSQGKEEEIFFFNPGKIKGNEEAEYVDIIKDIAYDSYDEMTYTSDLIPVPEGNYISYLVCYNHMVDGEVSKNGVLVLFLPQFGVERYAYVVCGNDSTEIAEIVYSFEVEGAEKDDLSNVDPDKVITVPIKDSSSEDTSTSSSKGRYIFPDSSSRELTKADIDELYEACADVNAAYVDKDHSMNYFMARELCYARNEIFARYGRKFLSPELQAYFNGMDWYQPKYEASEFDYPDITDLERKNVDFLKEQEKKYGGYTPAKQ